MTFFIRTMATEGFVEAASLQDAFVEFVKQNPLDMLGMILLGHTEYFPEGPIPDAVIGVRVTIPLVAAGIWTKQKAKAFNQQVMGKAIV